MSISTQSINSTDFETGDVYQPTLEEVAVAITFRQTIEQFAEEMPKKLKWSDILSESDVRRFVYYNLIEPADVNMGIQTVWQLRDWVLDLLDATTATFNFSAKQIRDITRYSDNLLTMQGEFHAKDTDLHGRSVGHLHTIDLIEMVEDNRNTHNPTVWTHSEKMERLCKIHKTLQ